MEEMQKKEDSDQDLIEELKYEIYNNKKFKLTRSYIFRTLFKKLNYNSSTKETMVRNKEVINI